MCACVCVWGGGLSDKGVEYIAIHCRGAEKVREEERKK